MPIADLYPIIDDRRYSDIVAEARTRIPRYTSEWTDLNENEPGMAVIELFGWMTELLIYRLGKVPALNYLKFLELLGIELIPAKPAIAEITFPVQPTFVEPYVIVPLHTQVESEEPDDEGSIVFETERAIVALTAQLDAVQTTNGFSFQDLSTANQDPSTVFLPFGPNSAPGNAVLFGFNSTLPFPVVEINLAFWVQPPTTGGSVYAACGVVFPPPATVAWEYWNGSEWYPLDLLKDETSAFSRSGHVYLNAPPKGSMVSAVIGKVAGARYWIRARLVTATYQRAPRLLAVRTNTVTAIQAQTIDNEILGGSNGRPEQTFRMTGRPVLDRTLQLVVDEGDGEVVWQEVPDFFASGPDDQHYVFDRTTGEVRFGDGRHGRIPVANARRPANIIARQYRFGGGSRGNLDAGSLTSLRGSIGGVDASGVINLFPTAGGGNEESLDDAKRRVPQALKSRDRAVTEADFEMHAKAAGGIARARMLSLFHPDFPGVQVPGVVSVVVVPYPDNPDDPAPMPTESTLRNVCRYLDCRRLATVELYVVAPRYREIAISAELVCNDDADLAEVKQAALGAIRRYFHPLEGGDDSTVEKKGSGWPFGGGIYYSLVLQRLIVPGVKRVVTLQIELEGEEYPECTDVSLDPSSLLKNGSHDLSVRYEDAS